MKIRPLVFALSALSSSVWLSTSYAETTTAVATKPSLTVSVLRPQSNNIATTLSGNGNIAAWQEASIGTETNGWRLAEVNVNVGDVVKRGQVLATFNNDMAQAELAQSKAAVAEAEANLAEAKANAQRARDLQNASAMSAQQINQYLTAEQTAKARLEVQKAAAKVQEIRLKQTQILAPDDGIISARSATVGAVVGAGQELFRLLRQSRLEWRAEVTASDLSQIKVGQKVRLTPVGSAPVEGKVRMVSPTVDTNTRNGLVYVDLPTHSGAKAGMFARGQFVVGDKTGLTVPQTAVLLREGYSYVFRVEPDSHVRQIKVNTGQRLGDRIEISSALDANSNLVASGVGFLSDGDLVRVAPASPK